MSSNPYSPPTSTLTIEQPIIDVPPTTLKKIKGAWVAGLISGCITLLVTMLAISGTSILGFDAWNFMDVALVFGLTYGIYKKSRVCAVLMLAYFVASKIFMAIEGCPRGGIILSLVFAYYFAQGISGTFAYHRLLKSQD